MMTKSSNLVIQNFSKLILTSKFKSGWKLEFRNIENQFYLYISACLFVEKKFYNRKAIWAIRF